MAVNDTTWGALRPVGQQSVMRTAGMHCLSLGIRCTEMSGKVGLVYEHETVGAGQGGVDRPHGPGGTEATE